MRNRLLATLIMATAMLVVLPAAGQAATSPPGIAASGTLPGTFNSAPVSVQVATIEGCNGGSSTFVAMWSGHLFRETPATSSDSCSNFSANGMPQSLSFSGPGTSTSGAGQITSGDLEGPSSPTNPSTVGFTITIPGGTLTVAQHAPGPLQGSPGRVQPFSSPATALKFVTQPSNSSVNTPISPSVTVEFVDSGGHLVNVSAPITIAIGDNTGNATLSGTLTENAVNGVATFSDLSLNRPDVAYTLAASSAGVTGATSTPFNESKTTSTLCTLGMSCSTNLGTAQSNLEVTANPNNSPTQAPGTLNESVDLGNPLDCSPAIYGGYTGFDPNWYGFSITGSADKLLTYNVIGPSLDNNVQFCFGANATFVTNNDGTNAAAGTLPDGTPGFIGLLPSCNADFSGIGPCIQSITGFASDFGSGVTITVFIPQSFADDPWGHA